MNTPIKHVCHQKAWQQYRGEIRAFLAHRAGSGAEADDLLQEVFLKALLQGKGFCQIDNPRAWLFHVARNLLVDRLRLTMEHVPLPDDLTAEPKHAFEPVDVLSHCLPRVLTELSPEDREAITLCDLQGVTQPAHAEKLGLSLPAAKSRVQRARLRLQAQLVNTCQVKFDQVGKVCCFVPRHPLNITE
jgi:RNA polymerase sigma-70 factor (ECF subfamily)